MSAGGSQRVAAWFGLVLAAFCHVPTPLFAAKREEALLIVGTTARHYVWTPMSQLLDKARDVERQTNLPLLPGLFVLTGIYIVHKLRKRDEDILQATAAEVAKAQAHERLAGLERLVAFGHALSRSLDHDSIRLVINQHLPAIAGTNQVWVLLRRGSEWEALAGDARGAHVIERQNLAERLLAGEARGVATNSIGFPLVVGGAELGVLGVTLPPSGLDPHTRRAIQAAAALLAVSLHNAQSFREARENGLRDPLTGCVTKAHAAEVMDAELRRAQRSQMAVSLIMFDLDQFKAVNDRYGHLCGDAVLAAIGRCMHEVLRASDLKCRFGGDEFLVLLPDTSLHGARRVAEALRNKISERSTPCSGDAVTVTASFGMTQALPAEITVPTMVARADAALYRAKAEGRNRVRVASHTFDPVDPSPNVSE